MAGENLGSIYYDIQVQTAGLLRGSQEGERALNRTDQAMRRVDQSSTRLSSNLTKLGAAFAAVASARALSAVAGMVNKYDEMADRIRLATSSQEEFEMVQKRLLTTANGTYRSLGEAQELYIRTADALRSMGYSTSQAIDISDSLSYALVKNATSAERANSAISAYSGAIQTGKVEADAWKTIIEAIPTVIGDLATSTHKTTTEIRLLGAQGKLTGDQLNRAFLSSLQSNKKAADEMSTNTTDAFRQLNNSLSVTFSALNKQTGALDAVVKGIQAASEAIQNFGVDNERMASFLRNAEIAGAALASVMAGRLIAAIGGYVIAQGKAFVATVAQVDAARAAAAANSAAAAAEFNAANAALALATANERAAVGFSHHAIAANELAIATARAEVAQVTLNAAMTAGAGLAGRAAIAMGVLGRAMAFLGGPVGVVLLAATALYYFVSSAKAAREEVDLLNGSLNKLSFNQLDRAALGASQRITDLNADLRDANKAYSDLLLSPDRNNSLKLTEARAAIDDVNDKLKVQQDQMAAIAKAREDLDKKGKTPAGTGKLPDQPADPGAAKILKGLKDQVDLLKVIGVERAKLKAIQTLGDEANPAQRIEAEKLAATIYQLEEAEKQQKASKTKGESAAASATKKAASEEKKGIEENQKAFAELGNQLGSVDKTARELALDQAQLSLNKYATPDQVQTIRDVAGALYDLKGAKQLLSQVDPIAAQGISYADELKALDEANAQKLISDQRYLELKHTAEVANSEKMKQLQEENFKAQALGNEILMNSIDALGQSAASAISGILSGTGSLQEALSGIANTVFNTVIGAFVQMGVDWVKQQIMMAAAAQTTTATQVAGIGTVAAVQAGATTAIAGTTTAAAATTGTAVAASMAPAAGLSSIASFGGAAVIGGAALLATMVLAKSFGGGRRAGGSVSGGSVYRVNEGGAPEVFNAGGQQYMIPNQRGEVVSNKNATADSGGGMAAAPIVNVNNYTGQGASQSSRFSEADNRYIIDVIVGDAMAGGRSGQTMNRVTGTKRAGT